MNKEINETDKLKEESYTTDAHRSSAAPNAALPENKMGTRPIPGLLLSMSLPAICSMTLQAVYNIVDSLFVARLSEQALSAVTLVFPVQLLIVAFSIGTSIGVNSLISRRLGQKNRKAANSAANHGFFLAMCNWVFFAVFGLFFSRMFFEWYSDTESLVSMATSYGSIVTILSIFMFIQATGEKVLQATGNMVMPMLSHVLGCVINIILDPIMIFGYFGCPAMGVAGAAYATIIGQFCGMIAIIISIHNHNKEVHVSLRGFRIEKQTIKDIYAVGFPSIIIQAIQSVAVLSMNFILISFSETAVAVLGVYFRIQSFIFMPVFGLSQGTMPILGYNYGARNKARFMHTFKLSLIWAVSFMTLGLISFQIFPRQLMMLFDPSADMMTMGVKALRLISLCFVTAACGIMISNVFQSMGHGFYSLLMSLSRQVFVLLPLAFILSKVWGVTGVWAAYPLAEGAAIFIALSLFIHIYKKEIVNMDKPLAYETGKTTTVKLKK